MKRDIAYHLRRALKESGKTQLEIAEGSGVDQGNLSRFLREERGVSLETAEELSSYLGYRLELVPRQRRK